MELIAGSCPLEVTLLLVVGGPCVVHLLLVTDAIATGGEVDLVMMVRAAETVNAAMAASTTTGLDQHVLLIEMAVPSAASTALRTDLLERVIVEVRAVPLVR